jgi:hypothetical protein
VNFPLKRDRWHPRLSKRPKLLLPPSVNRRMQNVTMKTPACVLVLLALPALAFAAGVYPGEPLRGVEADLGPPQSEREFGDKVILYYNHGQVRLDHGRVVDSDFSPDAFAAEQAESAANVARHKAEGEALKAKTDADPNFAALSPAGQVDFWEGFRRQYPEVSCESEYEAARAKQRVNIGDSLGQVQFALGDPRSQAQIGDKLILYYRRGQVQFVDGHVVSSDLPTGPRAGFTPGESLDEVRAALGEPRSQEQAGNKTVWYYGWRRMQIMVQFVDGKVVSPAWQPPNDDDSTSQPQTATGDANASTLNAQHLAEGEALKAKTLADPGYAAMSPGDQLALWADFRTKYPEVSCDNEYNAALARWKSQSSRTQQ